MSMSLSMALVRHQGAAITKTVQRVRTLLRSTVLKLCAIYAWASKRISEFWSGAEEEEPKIVIYTGAWKALQKCAIHIPPIAATAALSSLNLVTYFIGAQYVGYNTEVWQSFDRLALQITAKFYVSTWSIFRGCAVMADSDY